MDDGMRGRQEKSVEISGDAIPGPRDEKEMNLAN
jgi:hypothetical protein